MNQANFIAGRQARWDQYRELVDRLGEGKADASVSGDFPAHYRRLCNDLALARERGYSLALVERLQRWMLEGHALLYRPRASLGADVARFFATEFPRRVRAEWWLVGMCSLLLFGPMLWLLWMIGTTPEFVYRILSPDMVERFESMYGSGGGPEGSADSQLIMFAYYIMNNVGVALRTFAGGLVFGIGSLAILLFNGLQIGAVAAHLSFEGFHDSFWSFVIGHGAFELPAIVLAGVAGLRLGLALVLPGRLRRIDALRLAGRQAVQLLYGVIAMLLLAAGLEAFWSASSAPATVKYFIGAGLWALVVGYFVLAGRQPDRPDRVD